MTILECINSSHDAALAEAMLAGYHAILMENAVTDFGKKVLKGTLIAAMSLGLLSNAEAAQKTQPAKAKTTVNVKQKRVGNAKVTQAQVYNLAASAAYNERVTELLKELVAAQPNADNQQLYNKACTQALQEVVTGKLKP